MLEVDNTIETISQWIRKRLEDDSDSIMDSSILPEMTIALAELVSARAKAQKSLLG